MNLPYCRDVLETAGVEFEPGLSPGGFAEAEARFAFKFPPDLRSFLALALPSGAHFPKWRQLDDPGLARAFA